MKVGSLKENRVVVSDHPILNFVIVTGLLGRLRLGVVRRNDVDNRLATRTLGEEDAAIDKSKQRVILTHTDIFAGIVLGTALANDDIAGENDFSAITLYAKATAFRVASVSRATACFLVCHD
jgi:hypothetical protein